MRPKSSGRVQRKKKSAHQRPEQEREQERSKKQSKKQRESTPTKVRKQKRNRQKE